VYHFENHKVTQPRDTLEQVKDTQETHHMKPTPYRGPRSSPRAKSGPPSEADIQKELAKILDQAHLLWTATANGGKRDKRTAAALKAQGLKPGVPDVLIFTPPPSGIGIGLAIELKREAGYGKQRGRLSPHQRIWLEELRALGWRAEVAYGLDHALEILRGAGYNIPSTSSHSSTHGEDL
jgi:hypothetical protein